MSDIYSWVTEGFDTKDLQEAKALLAELAGTGRGNGETGTATSEEVVSRETTLREPATDNCQLTTDG